MNEHFGHMETVAIRKSGVIGWEPYIYERIGDDGVVLTGSIPRLLKSGPRKGKKTWDHKAGTKVIVTNAEIESEKADYIARTGNCGKCFGAGMICSGWSAADGTKMATCKACSGSGRANQNGGTK